MASHQKAFRLPEDVIGVLKEHSNATEYVVAAIREKAQRDKRRAAEESLACLGEDPEDNNISDFAEAQREVMRRVD